MTYYCDNSRHLVCKPYSVEGFHLMANDLNIKKCWFHNSKSGAHYDIPKKRVQEIQSKCIVVSTKEIWRIIHGLAD